MATDTSGNHHREHAEHNEEVFNYLRQDLNYIDWVITTAFYAALHYVEFSVFPLKLNFAGKPKEFKNLEEYHDFIGKKGKHQTRLKIVKDELSACRRFYEELFSLCMTARYHDYKFNNPKQIEKRVEKCLSKVKKTCIN